MPDDDGRVRDARAELRDEPAPRAALARARAVGRDGPDEVVERVRRARGREVQRERLGGRGRDVALSAGERARTGRGTGGTYGAHGRDVPLRRVGVARVLERELVDGRVEVGRRLFVV